nr:IS3 family transposase [Bradyrhizobium archetypum]
MSERRACKTIGCCRMTIRYQTTRADEAGLRQRMRAIAQERRRFGYRRLHVLLKREGYLVNHKKLFRLYREERLAVRRRGGRKRAIGTRAPMTVPMAPNDRWSLDFVSDQLTDGRRFRILTVVDDCTRECLALVADTSLSGTRVARELDRLVIERQAQDGGQRQRHRTHQQRHPDMGRSEPRRLALYRAGQTHAECLHRELQRPAAG